MSYGKEWALALERTRSFGLEVPAYEQVPADTRLLTAERAQEFPYVVRDGLGDLDFPDVVAQCLSIHYRLVPVLEDWLGCRVLYTMGWIDTGTERGLFKFDDAFIAHKLESGHSGGTVNMHAWLTLPSMEIIDVALATSMAVIQGSKQGHGAVLAKHPDEIKGLAYKPMLVGSDFLSRSGLFVEFGIF